MKIQNKRCNVFLGRLLIIIILLLLLQGCASVRMAEQVEQGKRSFVDGNYKQALHDLLPVAAYGNPEAQYAVGFIYYNGYSVTQDTESGIFWMTMSANQGYEPAKKALQEIQKENLRKAGVKQSLNTIPEKPKRSIVKTAHNDDVLQSLVSAQLLHQIKKDSFHGKKDKYTLQLFGSYHKSDVKILQLRLSSTKTTHCWHTKRDGKDWFVLTYGEFKTAHAAKSALSTLPRVMHKMNPWVRPTKQLELA